MRALWVECRRGFHALAAALLGALAWSGNGCGGAPSAPAHTLSVILISIDTLRADHVGLYGYARDTTPFLDRFARGATVFEHAFTVCPWTLVAHMTMLTGLFPAQHGVVTADLGLSTGIPTLAQRLQAVGYQTVGLYFSSWIHPRFGFDRGFDVFRAHGSAEEGVQHVREELARLDRSRPYFLFFHLFDVHNGPMATGEHMIYPSPEPFQDLFLPGAVERLPKIPPDVLWESENLLKPDELEALVALYDGGIRHVDTRLAETFEWLEAQGLLANTLVIVTADHGEALGQRGRLTGHGEFAQEGLHVPLIVRRPDGVDAGRRVGEVVHLGDLVPTILDLAGMTHDPNLPGRSLFGPLPPERVITGTNVPTEFVVRWPRKIIHKTGTGSVVFDLERDPDERKPVRAPDELFESLKKEAFPSTLRFPAPIHVAEMPAEHRAMLRALGYGGEDEEEEEDR